MNILKFPMKIPQHSLKIPNLLMDVPKSNFLSQSLIILTLGSILFSTSSHANIPKICDGSLNPEQKLYWSDELLEDSFIKNLNDLNKYKSLGIKLPINENSFLESVAVFQKLLLLASQQRVYNLKSNRKVSSDLQAGPSRILISHNSMINFGNLIPVEEREPYTSVLVPSLIEEYQGINRDMTKNKLAIGFDLKLFSFIDSTDSQEYFDFNRLGGSLIILALKKDGENRTIFKIGIRSKVADEFVWTINFEDALIRLERNSFKFDRLPSGRLALRLFGNSQSSIRVRGIFATELLR